MRLFSGPLLAACTAIWLGGVGSAAADTPVTYTQDGRALFGFNVPDFWALRTGGPREIEDTELGDTRAVSRVMGMRPVTDDTVWMGFVSPAGVATIEDGVRYLQDIDKFLVKDPTITSTSDTRIGGLPARVFRGTGRRESKGVSFTAALIDLPKNRVAVAVAILRDGANPDYADDLNAVFASFRSFQ
ncbi:MULTISPECIES: hypothetical protein [unclassified Ruegeria]|uniref:hypothetical protein n=1 Tax=unclassified Ruegeria TaxID=2625375 RepID=UPI0014913F82|nr:MULTISPECIES: hypothetical protein [unclassified Ruegeria]NOD46636.1 hypothetical protein [Ruegeria sp. HKCCD5849]NOD50064.1 hypothetical protein [Ruegeria sp. HKCCD5851]NOD66898.1 hypothetical protein [Ruegeria sp. HKCCD7303]